MLLSMAQFFSLSRTILILNFILQNVFTPSQFCVVCIHIFDRFETASDPDQIPFETSCQPDIYPYYSFLAFIQPIMYLYNSNFILQHFVYLI